MAVKKSARGLNTPGVHPGLMEKLRDAEQAELEGRAPREANKAQKVVRPVIDVSTQLRKAQAKAVGLVEGAHMREADPLTDLAQLPGYMPGVDLDTIWDNFSESMKIRAGAVERFRLEIDHTLRRAAMPWHAPHEIGGRLDARNLDRMAENLQAEIEAYDYWLARDTKKLLTSFIQQTCTLLKSCLRQRAIAGVDAAAMGDLLTDWLRKLLYQDICSRRSAMGDRGIRRIVGNIELGDAIYKGMTINLENIPRQRLLMRLIHIHQDLGHTAYAARVSYRGTKMHYAYGARIFMDERNRYRVLFTHDELDTAQLAVATHGSEEFPFQTNTVLALVRAVDHLAGFSCHRVDLHLQQMPGSYPYLDAITQAAAKRHGDTAEAKATLGAFLDEANVEGALRDDILAALRPFARGASIIELGQLSGVLDTTDFDMQKNQGILSTTLLKNDFMRRYGGLFDYQQGQLLRVARSTHVSIKELLETGACIFEAQGFGALKITTR